MEFSSSFLHANPLDESLVLFIDHDPSSKRVAIIFDYAAEAVSRYFESIRNHQAKEHEPVHREFRAIVFDGVTGLAIDFERAPVGQDTYTALRQRLTDSAVVFTSAAIINMQPRWRFVAGLCGGIHLSVVYDSATVHTRTGRAVQQNDGTWIYVDIATGEHFSMERPFAL